MTFVVTSFVCVSLILCANAISNTDREKIQDKIIDVARECYFDYKISAANIISLRDFKVPSDTDVSCFLDCVFKKLKVIGDDGKVTPLEAKKAASTTLENSQILNNIEGLVSDCSSAPQKTTGKSQCVGSYSLFKCLINKKEKFDLTISFKKQP